MTKLSRLDIDVLQLDLAFKLQTCVVANADKWKLVRKFALEADGRTSYNSNYSRAYRYGKWALNSSAADGQYHYGIDLNDPFIIHLGTNKRVSPSDSRFICGLLPQDLDVNEILSRMAAQMAHPSSCSDQYLNQIAKESGLERATPEELARFLQVPA